MPTAYSKDKMFADPDSARRSLHDDLAKFFREALHFETPLKRVISSTPKEGKKTEKDRENHRHTEQNER